MGCAERLRRWVSCKWSIRRDERQRISKYEECPGGPFKARKNGVK
jgi:hypothetical protein